MPATIHLPKDHLVVCGLLMLLGGCVHPRAVAPETKSSTTPAPVPATTPPSFNDPASKLPPQSAVTASGEATKSPTVSLHDVVLPPGAPSKSSAETRTPNRQGSPLAAAVSSSKPGAAMPVAKNVPPPAAAATALTQTAPTAAALDLTSLEQRLRDTHAIGIFTKLSLKNQVDDLLAHFKSYHNGQVPPTLTQLRQNFELLLIKVVTVLQDGDPPLATAVSTSREALWSVLSDPQKFAQI